MAAAYLNKGLRVNFQLGTLLTQAAQQDCNVRETMCRRCVNTKSIKYWPVLGAGLAELCAVAYFVLHAGWR